MIKNLDINEEKLRNIHLRKLALGEIQGPPTGYASIDKPWLKYYSEKNILISWEKNNVYDYFIDNAPDDQCLIDYYGKKYYKKDIKKEVKKYIKNFSGMGICEGSSVSFIMLDVPEVLIAWLALSKMGATTNLIKFDESPERIKLMHNIGDSEYMFISEVPFIINNVIESIKLGNNIKEVITVPISQNMPKSALIDILYNESKKNAKDNSSSIVKELKNSFLEFNKNNNETRNSFATYKNFISFKEWNKKYRGKIYKTISGGSENISIIVYTGGTTGSPKGVQLSNDNVIAMAHDFKYSEFGFTPGKTSMNILPPGPAYYLNATYGLMCCGVMVRLISKFTVEEYPELIAKYKPNIFLSGPILLKSIVDRNIIDDTSFITDPISGGDKLHLAEEERFNDYVKENNGGAVVHQGYGESESTAAATYSKTDAYVLGTIGIPMIDVEVAIFEYVPYEEYDKNTLCEKRYNEIGEICITGPTIMKGYRNNPEETNKVLRIHNDGKYWLHTDDLGYMDNNGRLFHCGRAKRMLTRAGSKVWLGALEDVIKHHPNVQDCCCVKLDDEIEREVPVAHIVLKDETLTSTFDEIDNLISSQQSESYIPKYYVKREDIPITFINKKVDFKQLESEEILNEAKYNIDGKVIVKKNKTLKKI